MKKIGIVFGKRKPEAKRLGFEITEWLQKRGHKTFLRLTKDVLEEGLDFIVTLGGDGLVLGTANKVAKLETPLFRVNFGRKGYLCDINPNDVFEKLGKILREDYKIESRVRIRAKIFQGDQEIKDIDALNEILVGGINRMVFAEMEVSDGKKKFMLRATGDGIILSTSTGSTGYSVNAGGSVVLIDNVFGIVASNALFESDFLPLNTKSFITSTEAIFMIRSLDHRKSNLPYVVADGQRDYKLKDGDLVVIQKSSRSTLFVKIE